MFFLIQPTATENNNCTVIVHHTGWELVKYFIKYLWQDIIKWIYTWDVQTHPKCIRSSESNQIPSINATWVLITKTQIMWVLGARPIKEYEILMIAYVVIENKYVISC